jgi:Domain of unknown function (DUF1996)
MQSNRNPGPRPDDGRANAHALPVLGRLHHRIALGRAPGLFGVALLLASLVMPTTAASADGSAGWLVTCTALHNRRDDPIIHPRQSGASHLHNFVGNPLTNAFSTYASQTAASPSGCSTPADTAGYWTPALYRNGVPVNPRGGGSRNQIYYRADNLVAGTKVQPFPKDFRMIAGNAMAKRPGDSPKLGKELYWGCSDNSTGKLSAPPASCKTGIISLHVGFPNCWDGVLTHRNDTPHVRYPSSGRCPAGFSHRLPRVILRWEYPVGTTTGKITLASGPTYTIHADFWNTWHQRRLVSLVSNCLDAFVNCGTLKS